MPDNPKAEIIEPPTSLRDKVTPNEETKPDFSSADDAIANLGVEFVKRLPEELAAIEAAFQALEDDPKDNQRNKKLFGIVHDLKGQAGTFDYTLITVIGNDLCRFLERPIEMSAPRLKVIGFHVEAMKMVAKKNITGDGGDHGRKMVDTLHSMVQQVLQE